MCANPCFSLPLNDRDMLHRNKDTSSGTGPNGSRAPQAPARWLWAAIAYISAAVAIVGIIVPGLPATPFLLLAAWAASRGSRRLHDWLHTHPQLGPPLADWNENRAVSSGTKALAVVFLVLSWVIMVWRGVPAWLLALLAILFAGVLTFIVTRPRPKR